NSNRCLLTEGEMKKALIRFAPAVALLIAAVAVPMGTACSSRGNGGKASGAADSTQFVPIGQSSGDVVTTNHDADLLKGYSPTLDNAVRTCVVGDPSATVENTPVTTTERFDFLESRDALWNALNIDVGAKLNLLVAGIGGSFNFVNSYRQ